MSFEIKIINGSPNRASTLKQRRAVRFCESTLGITFDGDINNFYEVSLFLSKTLDVAKMIMHDLEGDSYE